MLTALEGIQFELKTNTHTQSVYEFEWRDVLPVLLSRCAGLPIYLINPKHAKKKKIDFCVLFLIMWTIKECCCTLMDGRGKLSSIG